MKNFIVNVLTGLIVVGGEIAVVIGAAYLLSIAPNWVLYIFGGILAIVFFYIAGVVLRRE